jgi:hypothetical protein
MPRGKGSRLTTEPKAPPERTGHLFNGQTNYADHAFFVKPKQRTRGAGSISSTPAWRTFDEALTLDLLARLVMPGLHLATGFSDDR